MISLSNRTGLTGRHVVLKRLVDGFDRFRMGSKQGSLNYLFAIYTILNSLISLDLVLITPAIKNGGT